MKLNKRTDKKEIIPDVCRVVVFHPSDKVGLHDRLCLVGRNLPQCLRTFSFAARKLKVKVASRRVHFQHLQNIKESSLKKSNFQTDFNNVLGNSVTFDMERCRRNSMLWET